MTAYEQRKEFGVGVGPFQIDLGEVVTNEPLNVPVQSTEIDSNDLRELVVFVDFTRNTGTAVKMTVEEAFADVPGASDWFDQQFVDDGTSPNYDTADAVWNKTTAITGKWYWRVPIVGNKTRLNFTCTVGSATDFLTVQVVGIG